MTKLTQKVLSFKNNEINDNDIVSMICIYVFKHIKTNAVLSEDEKSDFLIFFHPRILQIINNFSDIGHPFECFLNVHIKYQLCTFLKKNRRQSIQKYIYCNSHFAEEVFNLYQTDDIYLEDYDIPITTNFSKVNRKRMFLALLKNHTFFNESEQIEICRQIKYDYKEVSKLIKMIEKTTSDRRTRFNFISERRNLAFYKLLQYEECLRNSYNDEDKSKYKEKVNKYKKTLRRLINELKAVMIHPTHKELSELLDIPKGTIDSSLYYLRCDYENTKAA